MGRALLAPPLRELLLQSVKAAAHAGGRLQLQLKITPPELAPLPWELITVGLSRPWSPGLRDEFALVRVSRAARPVPPAAVAGPLHVLAVAAPGEELQLDALELALADEVRAGRIELRLLRDATPASLERALMTSTVHVLHCAAAVAMTERGTPRLMLRRGLDTFGLTELLADADGLRLVTLAGPQGDASGVGVALPALAARLAANLPATIAFGGPLPARLSARFAAACYGSLAGGAPVDLAATAGRRALAETSGGRGWGLMQLLLAPGAEQLFAFRGRPYARFARLPRALVIACAGLALAGAIVLGERLIGPAHAATPALTDGGRPAPQRRRSRRLVWRTPTPTSAGMLKTLFGSTSDPNPGRAGRYPNARPAMRPS